MIETTGQRNLKKTQKVSLMIKFIKILVLALLLPVSVKANEIVDGKSAAKIIEEV